MYNEHANGAEDLVQVRWRTFTKLLELKLSPLQPYICVNELSQPAACSVPSHYLNQFCFIANWTVRNKFDMNMKRCILPLLVLFHWYICLCYNAHKRCTKENTLKLSDVCVNVFSVLGRIPSGTIYVSLRMPAVAICDLSQFVIKALKWHIDSNYTKKVLWVLGRVPIFTFDIIIKSFIFADSGVISLVHLFYVYHL